MQPTKLARPRVARALGIRMRALTREMEQIHQLRDWHEDYYYRQLTMRLDEWRHFRDLLNRVHAEAAFAQEWRAA